MRILPFLCLMFGLALAGVTVAQAADPASRIDNLLSEQGLTGAAWVLVDGDDVRLGAAGFGDNEQRLRFSPDTRFHVGSVTKAVLATGVLRMATAGLLDLDAPVANDLGEIRLDNPWRDEAPVTVRHLLDHTSGLEDARLWQMFSIRPTPDTPLQEAFPVYPNGLPIRTRPGSQFSYSNSGYGLLGMVIEQVSGQRYEAWLDRELLAPLGLINSTFEFTTQTGPDADPSLAWGHIDDGSRYPAAPIFLRPAGQFTTSAGDLGRLLQFLMGDGRLDGQPFISESLMRARGRPSGTRTAMAGLEAGYALGLARRDRHGVVGYCHPGNIVGFVAMLCVYPEQHKAFAYSVNTDSETADYNGIARALVDALEITPPAAVTSSRAGEQVTDWFGLYAPRPNRFATFEYLDMLFGLKVLHGDTSAVGLWSLQGSNRVLTPTGGYLFSANDRSTTSHVLMRDRDGDYLYGDGFQTLGKVQPFKIGALWLSLLAGMAGLMWLALAGLVVTLRRRSLRHPLSPALIGVGLLLVPIPLLIAQPFMALGDLTVGSVTLAVVTGLLPILLAISLGWQIRSRGPLRLRSWHQWATVCALQWCLVLAVSELLPLRLWN